MIYSIRFWFDFGGVCLWGMNEAARNKYGYAIDVSSTCLSVDIKDEIYHLQKEYSTYIDLSDPLSPSKWSPEKKNNFLNHSKEVVIKIRSQLGKDYEIIFDVEKNLK